MKNRKSKIIGFTGIELLLVTTILMTVTGFGVANYVNFDNRQRLEQAGKDLKNNLRAAQNSALSGEKDPSVCLDTDYLLGWCFSPSGVNEYSIYGGCSPRLIPEAGDVSPFRPKGKSFDKMKLKAYDSGGNELADQYRRIIFKPVGDDRVGIFNAGGALREITYCLSYDAIYPALPFLNLYYKIAVTAGGDIQDYGVLASCP